MDFNNIMDGLELVGSMACVLFVLFVFLDDRSDG